MPEFLALFKYQWQSFFVSLRTPTQRLCLPKPLFLHPSTMRKIALLTLTLMGCLTSLLAQTDTLYFKDYLSSIATNHPIFQQIDLIDEVALQEIRKARGAFDPVLMGTKTEKQFNTTEYYNKFFADIKIPTLLGFDIKGGYEQHQGEYLNSEMKVPDGGLLYAGIEIPVLRNLIFDKRRADLRQAEIHYQMSLAEQQKVFNKFFFDAAKAYWDWYARYELLLLGNESLRLAIERGAAIKDAVELGKYRPLDSIEANMEIQRRQVEQLQSLINYENARLELSKYMWSEDEAMLFIRPDVYPSLVGGEVETFLVEQLAQEAAENHPEILKQQQKIKSVEIDRKLYKYQILPEFNLEYKPLLAPQGDQSFLLQENYKFGFSFYAPLLMRKERASFAASGFKLRQENYNLDFIRRDVRIEIEQSSIALQQTQQMLQSQRLNVEGAEKMRNGEQTLFELGSSSFFYINVRERYLIESQAKLIDLKAKYAKFKAEIRYAAGQLPVQF
jgi:outer membrane protein